MYYEFHKLMKDEKILEKVSHNILTMYNQKYAPKTPLKVQDIMESLKNADKDLFIKFRDGKMTMDQLKVR